MVGDFETHFDGKHQFAFRYSAKVKGAVRSEKLLICNGNDGPVVKAAIL